MVTPVSLSMQMTWTLNIVMLISTMEHGGGARIVCTTVPDCTGRWTPAEPTSAALGPNVTGPLLVIVFSTTISS
jgi:hypothetical protein